MPSRESPCRALIACLLLVPTAAALPQAAATEGPVWLDPSLPAGWFHEGGDEDAPAVGVELSGLLSILAIDHGTPNREDTDLDTEAASLILQGWYGDRFRFWIEPDLDGEDTPRNLVEAWAEARLARERWLRAGQFRVALATEFATRAEDLPVPGHAFTSWLGGRTDTGVRLDGYAEPDVWYECVATTGSGFDMEGKRREHPQLSFRGVFTSDPVDPHDFQGCYAGFGLAYSPDGDDHILLMTPAEQTVFTTADLGGDEALFVAWELGVRHGPFRAALETLNGTISGVPVPGGEEDMDQLDAWTLLLAWSLRGEAPRWERGAWTAYGPEDFEEGKPLPIEFAYRYSNADIDRKLFDMGLTSYAVSSQETRTLSAAITAYTSPDTRWMLAWVGTIADRELGFGQPDFDNDNRARNWILRWDHWFGR
ncbi:MAG: hypothetical protein ACYTG2_15925 [Planctomycetota bacterium]|jgi:hypothetical protein